MRHFGGLLAVICMVAFPSAGHGKLYRNGVVGKTITAAGGEDRDLFSLSVVDNWTIETRNNPRDPKIAITLRAGSKQPITLIAYDMRLNEIGRASSDTGVVSLVTDLGEGWDNGYLRVVPSGGRYDTPVGSKFKRTVEAGGSMALLPPYLITFERPGGSSPTVQTASNVEANAPKSGASGATFSRWRAAPTPDAVIVPAMAAAPIGPVDAKRWGALASMVGTVWKDQVAVYTVEWDKPGEAIRFKSEGLLGEDESFIVPDADGKSLRYVYLNTATKQQFDQRIAVERGKAFVISATPTHRTLCEPVSKGTALSCVTRKYVRDKQPDAVRNFTRTDAAGAAALLASFPVRFPGRPAGQFDPQLGVLADMAGRQWTSDPKPTAGSVAELFEFGRTAQGPALITTIRSSYAHRVAYLQANGAGPLKGSYYAGSVDYPDGMGNVTLTVSDLGVASICTRPGCDHWLLSRDGQTALRMRDENGQRTFATYRPIPAAEPSGNALLDRLHGKTFMGPKKRTLAFLAPKGAFRLTKSWATGERHSTICYTGANMSLVDCYRSATSKTTKDGPLSIRESEIEVDGYVYAVRGENIGMRALGSAEEQLFQPTSAGMVELAWHNEDDREEQIRLRRENRIQTAEKARRSREMYGAIMGAAQAIGGAMAGNSGASNAFQPTVYRNTSSGVVAQPSGYSSMGTTRYVPHAPASAAYLQQQDELQRFQIREQLYGSKTSSSSSQPYAKVLEQRDRAAEESYARKAALDAQIQASRDQEARAFANSLTSNQGGGAANSGTSSGSSSTGGIIVSNGQPSATALKAQADEKAKIAAANERHRLAEIERKRIEADMARQDAEFKARINTFDKGVCPLSENAPVVCR